MSCRPTSAGRITYGADVAPPIGAPSRFHRYVNAVGAFAHVPFAHSTAPPATGVPEMVGGLVLTGAGSDFS